MKRSASGEAGVTGKRRHRRWLWFAIPLALVFLFYATIGFLATTVMVGNNSRWRGISKGPADFGLSGEAVSFPATDGVPIKAWWLPAAAPARGTVIVAPSGEYTRQVLLPRAAFLVHGGYNVLDFDLRGHGESGGDFISPGLVEKRDVLGAIRYVRSRGEREPIVLMGVCGGGVASLFAAAESPDVRAVISDSAYLSGYDVFRNLRDYFLRDPAQSKGQIGIANTRSPVVRAIAVASYTPGIVSSVVLVYYVRTGVWLGFDLVSVLPAAARVSVPVMIISGEADWIVPPSASRRIFDAVPGAHKRFLGIPNAGHDGGYSTAPDLYRDAVLNFLDGSLAR
ncbi:MAG TPA: alpha/beta fold hydrolase [Bryobacteraceae bacterium]|nr:alpha/beta fold hydrolase [Bryobacteraceae bacterium]